MDRFTKSMLETALWSSTDNSDDSGGDPLDKNYSIRDFSLWSLRGLARDAQRFQRENREDLSEFDSGTAGHDFWLTRNGHGAGFWDGDYPEPQATRLTDSSKKFGEIDLYVGDDGKIYASGYEGPRRAGSPKLRRAKKRRVTRGMKKRSRSMKSSVRSRGRGSRRSPHDPHAWETGAHSHGANNLILFADNTGSLYDAKKKVIAEVKRRLEAGSYAPNLGKLLWEHWFRTATILYRKEFRGATDPEDREMTRDTTSEASIRDAALVKEAQTRKNLEAGFEESPRRGRRSPGSEGRFLLSTAPAGSMLDVQGGYPTRKEAVHAAFAFLKRSGRGARAAVYDAVTKKDSHFGASRSSDRKRGIFHRVLNGFVRVVRDRRAP